MCDGDSDAGDAGTGECDSLSESDCGSASDAGAPVSPGAAGGAATQSSA